MKTEAKFDTTLVVTPPDIEARTFTDAKAAVQELKRIYSRNTQFLRDCFAAVSRGETPGGRARAFYPELRFTTNSYAQVDSRLAYGHVSGPGVYTTTITRPDLFETYLEAQIALLLRNHDMPISVGESKTPIPLHFAFLEGTYVEQGATAALNKPLRDRFQTGQVG